MGKQDIDRYLQDQESMILEGFTLADIMYLKKHKAELRDKILDRQNNLYLEQLYEAANQLVSEWRNEDLTKKKRYIIIG